MTSFSSSLGKMAFGGATIRPNPTGLLILFVGVLVFIFYVNSNPKWWRSDPQVSLKELLSVSIDLARLGGSRVRKIQEGEFKKLAESLASADSAHGPESRKGMKANSKGLTKEGAKELITEGDINSHRAIVYGFNKAFPGLHLISEEHDIKPPDFNAIPMPTKNLAQVGEMSDEKVAMSAVTVWIDPLDATQEYSEMRKEYNKFVTVMICVAVHGRPVIGVVHQPFVDPPPAPEEPPKAETSTPENSHGAGAGVASPKIDGASGQTFWGWVGHGVNFRVADDESTAAADGRTKNSDIVPSTLPDRDSPTVIVSLSHAGQVKAVVDETFGNRTALIKAGGAGYKVLAIVEKRADLYYHHTRIKKWDICAGNALIESLGGRMTTLDGAQIVYDYDLNKIRQMVDGKLVVALKDKHEEYRRKLSIAVDNIEKKKNKKP